MPKAMPGQPSCRAAGCEKPVQVKASGHCRKHHRNWEKATKPGEKCPWCGRETIRRFSGTMWWGWKCHGEGCKYVATQDRKDYAFGDSWSEMVDAEVLIEMHERRNAATQGLEPQLPEPDSGVLPIRRNGTKWSTT